MLVGIVVYNRVPEALLEKLEPMIIHGMYVPSKFSTCCIQYIT